MPPKRKAQPPPAPIPHAAPPSLEDLLTLPSFFSLDTATPCQRAICRIIDGAPLAELASDPDVVEIMGGADAVQALRGGSGRPKEVYYVGATRGAKTLLMAVLAFQLTQIVDVSVVTSPKDLPRVSILSISVDSAKQCWDHLTGHLPKPTLNGLVVDIKESEREVIVRQERTGKHISIKIVAGAAAGGEVISRWCAGVICDEATRMGGGEAVVNLENTRKACIERLLPGAQFVAVGSTWGAQGYVYERWRESFGKPRVASDTCAGLVVIYAKGPQLNPFWWTPEAIAKGDPEALARDCWLVWGQLESDLMHAPSVDLCMPKERPLVLAAQKGVEYAAAIDPASRRNAFTLVVKCRLGEVDVAALAHQWDPKPGEPLVLRKVFEEMRALLLPYGVSTVITDQWASDALRELAYDYGITLVERRWGGDRTFEVYEALRIKINQGRVQLPPMPEIRADLLAVKRKLTPSGQTIELVKIGRRHADYAPALALACEAHTRDGLPVKAPQEPEVDQRLLTRLRANEEAAKWANGKRAGSVSWLRRR